MALSLMDIHSGIKPTSLQEDMGKELENSFNRVRNKYAEPNAKLGMQEKELANAYNSIKNQYAPQDYETKFNLRNAQAHHAMQQAQGGGKQGHARNIEDLTKLMQDPNIPKEYKAMAVKLFETDISKGQSLVDTRNQNIEYKPWTSLKADDQYQITGQYRALGIDARRAIELWNNGITPEKIAQSRQKEQIVEGATKPRSNNIASNSNPEENPFSNLVDSQTEPNMAEVLPKPGMTGANRGAYNELQANKAEASYLGNWVTEHIAPYSQFPTPKDAYTSLFKRHDKAAQQERHEFLAASMMGPETALLNAKLANGSTAAQAITDIENRLKLNARNLGITVTPKDYLAATRIMHRELDKAAHVRGEALRGANYENHKPQESMTIIRNPKTGETRQVTVAEAEKLVGKKR